MQTPSDTALNIKYVSSGAKRARQTEANTLLVYRDPTSAPYTEPGDGITIVTDPVTGISTVSSTGVLGIAHTNHGISGPSQAGDLTLVAGDGISITSPQDGEIVITNSEIPPTNIVNTVDGMTGDLTLTAGAGIAINSVGGNVSITNTGIPGETPGVLSIVGHSGTPLIGNVILDQGSGILVSQTGQTISVAYDPTVSESVTNKSANLTFPNNTKYPTTLAVSDALAGCVTDDDLTDALEVLSPQQILPRNYNTGVNATFVQDFINACIAGSGPIMCEFAQLVGLGEDLYSFTLPRNFCAMLECTCAGWTDNVTNSFGGSWNTRRFSVKRDSRYGLEVLDATPAIECFNPGNTVVTNYVVNPGARSVAVNARYGYNVCKTLIMLVPLRTYYNPADPYP